MSRLSNRQFFLQCLFRLDGANTPNPVDSPLGDPRANPASVIPNEAKRNEESEESEVAIIQAEFRSWNGHDEGGRTS